MFSLFANQLMLWGATAASIPIIIHLLNRQRFKRVMWAAMHWLWASYKKSRRRLQVEQLLLLIIRTLILLLLAMALARPALNAAGILGGRATVQRVIVLDNSYSMGQMANGKPLFQKAKDFAIDLASRMAASDDIDVVCCNSVFDEHLASSALVKKSDIINQIKAAGLSDGGTDAPKSIAAACRVLNEGKSTAPNKEIIFITDQTRAGWEHNRQPRKLEGEDEAAVKKAFSGANRPRILIVRMGSGEKEAGNIAAAGIEVEEKVVPAGVETQLAGTVVSFSHEPLMNVRVKLKVDNEEVAADTIGTITRDKPEAAIFRYSFLEPGSHGVAIELENDALPADNTAHLAVDVEQRIRVLCVDGQQRVGANASEMDYFRQALSPEKSEEVKAGKMPLFPEVISDTQFSEANLDDYRLIVLGNVAQVPREKIPALTTWVRQGGALWVFCGDRVDPALYNKDLDELLPMALGDLIGSGDPEGAKEALSDKDLDHPAIVKFKGIRGFSLSQLQTYRRFRLLPKPQPDPSVRNVLAYENGDAAAVEMTVGAGRVMFFGTTADTAWNNWPAKSHYMPLINFIALDLIRPAFVQRNRMVGERFVLQLPRQDVGAARREGIRLIDPAGESSAMEVQAEQATAESGLIRKAGVYTAVIPGESKRTLYFAANRNLEESDLAGIDDRELLSLIPREGETRTEQAGYFKDVLTQADIDLITDDPKAVDESLKKRGGSKELWRWLVMTVIVLLVVESVMARRFGDFAR